MAFMSDPLNPLASVPSQSDPRKHWSDVPGFESVRLLTEANFDATIADNPSVLVMFYAPCKFQFINSMQISMIRLNQK